MKMRALVVFNTMDELVSYLDSNAPDTLVNVAAFGLDLLDLARENDNEIEIGNDGGFIRVDEMGYVVEDFAIDNVCA
jgi:hypothetical protein